MDGLLSLAHAPLLVLPFWPACHCSGGRLRPLPIHRSDSVDGADHSCHPDYQVPFVTVFASVALCPGGGGGGESMPGMGGF
jgi:hypothetical protein